MKKLEINDMVAVSGGNICFYLGIAAAFSLANPWSAMIVNGIAAAYCFS